MNFTNVRLILAREVRDQLRDPRTLFMIFVLPVLLYPLLGTAYFQMIQFQTRNSMTVRVVGGGQLASAPTPLIEGAAFATKLFPDGPCGAELLKLEMAPDGPPSGSDTAGEAAEAGRLVEAKKVDAALIFPPDFAQRLEAYRKAIHEGAGKLPSPSGGRAGGGETLPSPSGRGAGGEGGSAVDQASAGAQAKPSTFGPRPAQRMPSPPAPLPKGEGSHCAPLPKGEGSHSALLPMGEGSHSALLPMGEGSHSALLPMGEGSHSALLPMGEGSHSTPLPKGEGTMVEIPRPKIIYTTANERSLMACNRLTAVLDRWTEEVGKKNLAAGGIPVRAVRPFEVDSSNLAGASASKSANIWSRMLPVLLLLWAMTGAFYPAVDLCAGEKERGTLETLLSSPAQRSEIVLGKLLTIMGFSMATAALNLVCVAVTGSMIFRQIENFGGPPPLAILWLSLALVPVSALFSALCLALASFARSTKEGQYYLMPLLMLSLPMAVLPMSPGVELSLGNSLVPISGLVLLLKTLLEGSYIQALQYLPIVLAVTTAACWLAVRWAVEQFNSESVLFRESERFAVGLWLRKLLRDRAPTPSAAEGVFCGVTILVLSFILRSAAAEPANFSGFARVTLVLQLAVILTPPLLMAVMLTSSPRQALLLRLPRWKMVPAAAVLAVAMHPFTMALDALIVRLYPLAPEMMRKLGELQTLFASADTGSLVLFFAAVPAVCEELAFRGFILSGCRNLGNSARAIVVSAIFFGAAHALLQQSINACLLGIVLGYLAVRSGSLLPGIVFHFLHNAMTVLSPKLTPELIDRVPGLGLLVQSNGQGPVYQWPVYVFGGVASLALLGWFTWFPEARNPEDILQEVFEQSADESLIAARG